MLNRGSGKEIVGMVDLIDYSQVTRSSLLFQREGKKKNRITIHLFMANVLMRSGY